LRLERGRRGGDDCVYIFELNRRHDLDGRSGRNVARLINHACSPNCRADNLRGRIWIVARRDIPAGEELTFDYGFAFNEWRQHPCLCGSKSCAGFIVNRGQRWRLRKIPRAERLAARSGHDEGEREAAQTRTAAVKARDDKAAMSGKRE